MLLSASTLQAQSIVDAQRVQFSPSTDDGTVGSDGTPLVQNYTLTVYVAGSSTAYATANLGKPSADSTGLITVDFSTLLTTPLQVGVIYESTVSAVGPGGSSESARSNTFELTTTCGSTVSTTTQNVAATASTGSVGVTATCAWAALSNATWLTITAGASGTGNGTVGFSAAANTLTSTRSGTLTVAGNTVTVNQAAAAAATVPGTPTNVAGSAGNAQVSLTWTAPSSNGGSAITGYQVQVATSATGTYSNAAGCSTTSTTTACTATGLTNGTTYFFKAAAINAVGTGSFSSASSGVTPLAVPGAPTGVSGTAGDTQVALTWTAPSNTGGSAITGYQVQVATIATGTYSNAAGCSTTSTTTACTATGLADGTTYFFKVAAINSIGTGSFSTASAGVTPAGVPGTPTGVSGTGANTQVSLTWTAPSSNGGSAITGYQVQVATSAAGTYSNAAGCGTTSTTTACTATGLTNGTTYFFKVAAINAVGTSSFSSASSGVTPIAVPGAPTGVSGTAGNTQVSLTWTAPSNTGGSAITGYQVQVATSANGSYSNAAGCSTTSTTTACTATGLTNGTTYFFKVAGINANGIGTYSSASSGVTPAGVPGAPTGVTGAVGNAQVSLTWNAPSSNGGSAITGYQVQVATSATGTYSNAAGCSTTSTTTACTATGLTNGTTYFFKVAAINAVGTGSYSAASSGVTPAAVPSAPRSLTVTAGNAQVALSWAAPTSQGGSAITGYQVQVATNAAGPFSNAAGCPNTSKTTSCTATGLTNGTTYFFRVAAINSIGTGTYTAVSSGVTPDTVPSAPSNVVGTAEDSKVALTWAPPSSTGGVAITGYRVQVATSATGTYSNAAGCPTTLTTTACIATGLVNGTTYFFKVAAMNAVGQGNYSSPSAGVTPAAIETVLPTLTFDRTDLDYAATIANGAFLSQTPAQTVHLVQAGQGNVTWTVTSNNPWLTVSPTSGSGSAILTVSVNAAAGLPSAGSVGATINVSATGISNTPDGVSVTLLLFSPGVAGAPFGSFDTPVDGTTGVTGSIALTGWALDDEGVSAVRLLRNAVAGEPAGQLMMIGNATFVDGARPDVEAANLSRPLASRAGWGYLMLTNMLPNGGNGTFTLYAYADDVDGHSTLLGTKTITCANATAVAPFGAIDTPGQGATVSGIVANFGWVLSPGAARADPPGGGTVTVLIDGVAVGTPSGWTSRSDLSSLFPVSQYSGVNTALGVFGFDSTTMDDGVHTIAWIVTDNAGNTSGVGSRFFSVFNGGTNVMAASVSAPVAASVAAAGAPALDTLPADAGQVFVHRGHSPDAPARDLSPDANGKFSVTIEELEPVALAFVGSDAGDYAGYARGATGLAPLPAGSRFDASARQFSWQPGPGFVGQYDLVFVRSIGGRPVARRDVTITLVPKGWRRSPHVVIDTPQGSSAVGGEFVVAGWAFDGRATDGTGISGVEVWAYPDDGTAPIYLGPATMGDDRPDLAPVYGDRAGSAGYKLVVRPIGAGGYTIAVFGRSTLTGTVLPSATVHIDVR